MRRLDPRAPLVVDTRELGRRPGSMRTVTRTVPAPADLGIVVIGILEGSPIDLDLRLESVVEGVLVSGTAQARAIGECVRCLDPVDLPVEVDLQELYDYPDPHQGSRHGSRRRTRRRRTTSTTCTSSRTTSSTSSRCCGTRQCSRCPCNRCAGTTARVCAPSAEPGSRTTRSTTTTASTLAGRRCLALARGTARHRKRADRGRSQAEDLAQQHPPPPRELEGEAAPDQQARASTAEVEYSIPHRADEDGQYNGRQVLDV